MNAKTSSTQRSAPSRAGRLHEQAMNCVTFAVRENDQHHAADLIDEAIRLERRSGELARSK